MKIKEIILEGFKSYGTRTVLEEFDPEFTGVTGLNGSGKSNVLDSICFVLGLRSLGLARAGKIQDLIYKGGQAGIKEASVTITFDNTDKSRSPVGYQDCKLIKVTRKIAQQDKTKYYINGVSVTHTAVTRMFKSIGLNIDRPETFFVQQGKITKIVNFKPTEALEMLLEAAGVAYYREVAHQTKGALVEKNGRLALTEERMNATFGPKIAQLERDRRKLHEFEALKLEIDSIGNQLGRLLKYNSAKSLTNFTKQLQAKQVQSVQLKGHLRDLEAEKDSILQECRKKDAGLTESDEATLATQTRLKDRKEKFDSAKLNFEKESTEHKYQEEMFSQKSTQLSQLEEERTALVAEMARVSDSHKQVENQRQTLEQKLQSAEEEMRNIEINSTANSSATEAAVPIQGRLDKCKERQFHLEQKEKERKEQEQRWTQEIKERKSEVQNELKQKADTDQEIKKLEQELESLKSKAEKFKLVQMSVKEAEHAISKLMSEEREAQSKLAEKRIRPEDFELSYRNPFPGFDRSQVLGRAFQLLTVAPHFQKAYEAGVSGKLMNIVVTKDEISMLLLKAKCLDTFAVFLPLNQLRWPTIPPRVLEEIQMVAKEKNGKIWLPDSPEMARHIDKTIAGDSLRHLVSYFATGWVICDSVELADQLSSNGAYSIRAVTLAGDVFDPSGQISGGFSDPSRGSFLSKWAEYKELRGNFTAEIGVAKKKLEDLQREQDVFAQDAEQCERLKDRLEKLTGGSEKYQFDLKPKGQTAAERVKDLERQLQASKGESENDQKELAKTEKEMKELEAVLKQLKSADRTQVQKTLKARLEAARADQDKMTGEKRILMQKACDLSAEVNRLAAEITKNREQSDKIKEQLKISSALVNEKKQSLQAKKRSLNQVEKDLEEAQKQFEELVGIQKVFKQKLNQKEKEISEVRNQLEKITGEEASLKSDIDKARAALGERNSSGSTSMLASAESFNPDPELDALDPKKLSRELAQKKEEYFRLEPAVRREAESERGRLAEQMADLFQKKDTVYENKAQIESNLEHMDNKSEGSVYDCFQFVNKNLGKIFNLLLPGAMAEMELMETHLENGTKKITGVQMRIGFNGHWKQSMTELSGGQRSLLALSFLLAMLQYKPAPFYILDEIDSAMDLSHTENIGYILSNFFPQSQFIVISLKGGLFNQANVLFRTALIDGRSVVTRYSQKKHKQKATMMIVAEDADTTTDQQRNKKTGPTMIEAEKENVPPQNQVNRIVPEEDSEPVAKQTSRQGVRGRRR